FLVRGLLKQIRQPNGKVSCVNTQKEFWAEKNLIRKQNNMKLNGNAEQNVAKNNEDSLSAESKEDVDRESMKTAIFNVTVMLMAIFFILGTFAAYFLFYDFVKPMIWALIAVRWVRGWLNYLYVHQTPLTVGVFTLPYNIVTELGDFILDLASRNLMAGFLIGASFPACSLVLYYETVPKLLVFLKHVAQNVDSFLGLFRGLWVPTVFLSYIVYIVLFSLLPDTTKSPAVMNMMKSRPLSLVIWIAALAYVCGYFGPFATPTFCVVVTMCSTYYFAPGFPNLNDSTQDFYPQKSSRAQEVAFSTRRRLRKESTRTPFFRRRKNTIEIGPTTKVPSFEQQPSGLPSDPDVIDDQSETDLYLRYLFLACFFVWISLHLWMIFILVVPVGLGLFRRLLIKFRILSIIDRVQNSMSTKLENDLDFLFPSPLRHLFKVVLYMDRQVIKWLRASMDIVGSFTAILVLIVAVAGLAGFVSFQLYYESLYLMHLLTNIANRTLTNNVAFQNWLQTSANATSVSELTDEAMQKAYNIGRSWLSTQVHDIITNDEEKARILETQIMTALNTFFNSWVAKKNDSFSVESIHKGALENWNSVWSAMEEEDWYIFDNIQEYLTVVWSIAESAWLVIKNNMEILIVALSQMLSTVIASGSAVIEFFLDSIVFFTFLMFLLSSSNDEYKPMKIIRDLIPTRREVAIRLTEDIEEAVSSVFLATFKMALFYGMFTWLTHTLLSVNIVFIPSVLASMFAAIPFFGTYIVAIPGVLELWLIRGEPFLAILLFILHYLPSYIVDDAIYSEIRLTTPFVTGMAITGGMLWWGLEGAIFGPLVLCCLLVTGSMYIDIFAFNIPVA
uniref:Transmembrane protein 245 n=1 Tax=Romanomermis culicivorax TaxID=13658 RepID=A0A915K3R3_ROMCU